MLFVRILLLLRLSVFRNYTTAALKAIESSYEARVLAAKIKSEPAPERPGMARYRYLYARNIISTQHLALKIVGQLVSNYIMHL